MTLGNRNVAPQRYIMSVIVMSIINVVAQSCTIQLMKTVVMEVLPYHMMLSAVKKAISIQVVRSVVMGSHLTEHHQQRSVVGMDCMTVNTKHVVGVLYTTHHLTSVVNLEVTLLLNLLNTNAVEKPIMTAM